MLATRINVHAVRGLSYFQFDDLATESFEWNDACLDFVEFGAARRPELRKWQNADCASQLEGPQLSRWRWWITPDAADEPYDFPEDRTPQGLPKRMWSGDPGGPRSVAHRLRTQHHKHTHARDHYALKLRRRKPRPAARTSGLTAATEELRRLKIHPRLTPSPTPFSTPCAACAAPRTFTAPTGLPMKGEPTSRLDPIRSDLACWS